MSLEEARRRLLEYAWSQLQERDKEISKKRLDLSVSVAVEGAYRHHGESPPWSYGIVGGPDDIRERITDLMEDRRKLLEEIQFLETATFPNPEEPIRVQKDTPMKLKPDGTWRIAEPGEEADAIMPDGMRLTSDGVIEPENCIPEPDPVKAFFTGS